MGIRSVVKWVEFDSVRVLYITLKHHWYITVLNVYGLNRRHCLEDLGIIGKLILELMLKK